MPLPTLRSLRLREYQLFLVLTIAVGVLAGLAAALVTVAVDRMIQLAFGLDPSTTRLFLVPTLVGLVTGTLVPLMVAGRISWAISRRFQKTAAYHALQRDQLHLPSHDARWASSPWLAADVMDLECEFVPSDRTVGDLWSRALRNDASAYVVGTPARLVGVVSRERLTRAADAGILTEPVASLVDARLVHGHPDHPADVVLERLARSHGVLPIVSREHAMRMVGVVTIDHLWRFMQRQSSATPSGADPWA